MKPIKQFWTLVKFQYLLNPMMWVVPLIPGVTSLIPFFVQRNSTYHSNLSFYFQANQTFFFVGIFGATILSPEKFQFRRMKAAAGFFGTEFLLTRAIDRPILYRAKAFLLYALILLLPIGAVVYFLRAPELIVRESSKMETQQLLSHVPGSTLSAESSSYGEPNITLPHGKVLIAEWHLWLYVLAIVALQLAILVLSRHRFGGTVFWVLCYMSLLLPTFLPLYELKSGMPKTPSAPEKLFYFFVEHQPSVWLGSLVAVLLCQFICERSFARQEQ